ncbi:alpha/beta hydrolase [Aspergillus avenaceus]|uniref:Alpha/beta hydrolase n=1 Tax=Aspergillus avenaceus TaxID=36643 RepID=A0A5N6TXP9_ASPAV|nr:alpha/beta hydrolase [Aspergillus avenaceus]
MEAIVKENTLIRGTRIAYSTYGEGAPVVLLHGTPSSSLIWRNIVPKLSSTGFKIHVYDLLGYGLSERPWDPSIDTSISGQVPVLEDLLTYWDLKSAHIVAHDIGGGIAQRLAVFSPEKVRSVTLIDVVSFDSYPSARTRQQMQQGTESLLKLPDQQHREHYREWLLSAVQKMGPFETSSLDTFLGYISGPVGQASLYQHQVRHYDPTHTLEVADRLGEMGKIPVKLIWGCNDAWQSLSWAEKLRTSIPGSELVVLDDCGHFAPEDQPELISKLLIDFLKGHS